MYEVYEALKRLYQKKCFIQKVTALSTHPSNVSLYKTFMAGQVFPSQAYFVEQGELFICIKIIYCDSFFFRNSTSMNDYKKWAVSKVSYGELFVTKKGRNEI